MFIGSCDRDAVDDWSGVIGDVTCCAYNRCHISKITSAQIAYWVWKEVVANAISRENKMADGEGPRQRPMQFRLTEVEKGARGSDNGDTDDLSEGCVQFIDYQVEMDARNDRFERLVKLSRDVTIEAKRTIFLLHRIVKDEDSSSILKEACDRISNLVKKHLHTIAKELVNEDRYSYARACSPGIQEFVEVVTYYYYLKEERLITVEEIKELVNKPSGDGTEDEVVISFSDYILGVADMTGELMRKCINSIGSGHVDLALKVCHFMRSVHRGFLTVGNLGPRELSRKTHVLGQSLQKVESACYTLKLRGSEVPKHMLGDVVAAGLARVCDEYEDLTLN